MPAVFKDLLGSKKFVFVLLATTLLLVAGKLGSMEEVQSCLKILWPVYLGAQGLADFGKHAVGAVAVAKAKTIGSPPPPDFLNQPPKQDTKTDA